MVFEVLCEGRFLIVGNSENVLLRSRSYAPQPNRSCNVAYRETAGGVELVFGLVCLQFLAQIPDEVHEGINLTATSGAKTLELRLILVAPTAVTYGHVLNWPKNQHFTGAHLRRSSDKIDVVRQVCGGDPPVQYRRLSRASGIHCE